LHLLIELTFPASELNLLYNDLFTKFAEIFDASMSLFSFLSKDKKENLDKGLSKTKENVFDKIARAVAGKSKVDEDVLDKLEEVLVTSDVGVETTLKVIQRIENRIARDKYLNTNELTSVLREEIASLLQDNNAEELEDFETPAGKKPYVIMVVGVNGVGKTTTIGKLAYHFKKAGKKVYLGAADTFRAAAVEQLTIWSERVDVPVVKQKMGADPASVAYDTLSSAVANDADVVIIDTAGRLHNKINLMNELAKIKNVMKKVVPEAPHEVLLILDGSTGQNAYNQAKEFSKATEITALAVTKLDGTAKGGVVIGISDQLQIPVKYIGIGEGLDDLLIFRKKAFVDSLFGD
jgi:fused signal recognition particle receptor